MYNTLYRNAGRVALLFYHIIMVTCVRRVDGRVPAAPTSVVGVKTFHLFADFANQHEL